LSFTADNPQIRGSASSSADAGPIALSGARFAARAGKTLMTATPAARIRPDRPSNYVRKDDHPDLLDKTRVACEPTSALRYS
jgi:hypothetical protein